ncbi:cysteine desulfurase family protein [Siphonobacter aquaeclarae]|uniref:cysteine desulfurase n=1 Tax=Siphonobacter aquaeclarae TaxID=563176 RepID=A0A1G9MW08_9BACT|nr:cysteine desulfurase family protein [Siphonobacter aquaeclarae]SDL78450.1 cysteine desulfurase [Siphonobacter aquaeclarae]
MEDLIYLDYNATTPLAPEVLEAMMPYLTNWYGNASSSHLFGQRIADAVKKARGQVADLIDCDPNEIVFTSGATESINLAIKGVLQDRLDDKRHIVTVQTEHPAVLDVCRFLETRGYEVTYLPVQPDGLLEVEDFRRALRSDTALATVMLVNNETGVIQPIQKLAELAHEVGALFMTDATQAVGKMPVSVDDLDVDLMAFSAHKFYGPKGVGGLFIRSQSSRKIWLRPIIHGGGQEHELRSGTLNVAGIVGMGKACQLSGDQMEVDALSISKLRDTLETALLKIDQAFINGSKEHRLYNVTNITFPNLDAVMLVGLSKNIAISNGSACTSFVLKASHVLKAMGLKDDEAFGALRFSFGRNVHSSSVDYVICEMREIIERKKFVK